MQINQDESYVLFHVKGQGDVRVTSQEAWDLMRSGLWETTLERFAEAPDHTTLDEFAEGVRWNIDLKGEKPTDPELVP
jgi:hypothetical protein